MLLSLYFHYLIGTFGVAIRFSIIQQRNTYKFKPREHGAGIAQYEIL